MIVSETRQQCCGPMQTEATFYTETPFADLQGYEYTGTRFNALLNEADINITPEVNVWNVWRINVLICMKVENEIIFLEFVVEIHYRH
jgi:hypothetical protein